MFEWRTIGSGLVRQRKAWMVASTFDNMYIWKFDTHRILSCIGFVDCLLKVFSIMQYWMVTIILDLSMPLEAIKKTHEVTPETSLHLLEFYLDEQV